MSAFVVIFNDDAAVQRKTQPDAPQFKELNEILAAKGLTLDPLTQTNDPNHRINRIFYLRPATGQAFNHAAASQALSEIQQGMRRDGPIKQIIAGAYAKPAAAPALSPG